jgi:hypothetical protein
MTSVLYQIEFSKPGHGRPIVRAVPAPGIIPMTTERYCGAEQLWRGRYPSHLGAAGSSPAVAPVQIRPVETPWGSLVARRTVSVVIGIIPPAPGVNGHWDDRTREIIVPDTKALRDALPHYWRAAFDRAQTFWYTRDGNNRAYAPLYDTRGRKLVTIYATPYRFETQP